jgi:ectoine hydroxylase-related dioxygenase (phytanoyl-CoA dioxygenase family)
MDRDGCAVIPGVFDLAMIEALRAACEPILFDTGARAGIRNVMARVPAIASLAACASLRRIVEQSLGADAFVARSLLFDKSPDANWNVVWHQDTTIAVTERIDVDGFGPWSVKHGTPHVQPPAYVLAGMISLRIHLDDCDSGNGPLLVVAGSHARGLLRDHAIDAAWCDEHGTALTCMAGDVIAMRPLILHASRKAVAPTRRRVIHLEFAAHPLPGGLRWACA